jgi:hypothetical protein
MKILIDFVPGAHGHFLEIILNKFFHTVPVDFQPFTSIGTSHQGLTKEEYNTNKVFCADHWYERAPEQLLTADQIISIQFDKKDLLLLSSISLLRAGDKKIDNDTLEIDTYNKLNNNFYKGTLDKLIIAYPFLKLSATNSSVPRNVLREFYKFSFLKPDMNGYWQEQMRMQYSKSAKVFYFKFDWLYNIHKFEHAIKQLEKTLVLPFDFSDEFYSMHSKFIDGIAYKHCQAECNNIVDAVIHGIDLDIPKLTLFQESYINAQLENYFKKEMPFHQVDYFTNTKDVLQYIETRAPNL